MKQPVDRFLEKVEKTASCWLWTGHTEKQGYGLFGAHRRSYMAHRFSYEHFKGPIPDGLQIDHMCNVKGCVNPDHLQAVTHAENQRLAAERRESCKKGHKWTEANTYIYPATGYRRCKKCHAEHEYGRYLKRLEQMWNPK